MELSFPKQYTFKRAARLSQFLRAILVIVIGVGIIYTAIPRICRELALGKDHSVYRRVYRGIWRYCDNPAHSGDHFS